MKEQSIRLQRLFHLFVLSAMLVAFAISAHAQTLKITADNSYALFYGNATSATTFVGTDSCSTAACIYAYETYTPTTLTSSSYIYIVTWSDSSVAQGLLTDFSGTLNILSGDPKWQVNATGINLSTSGAPNSPGFLTALNGQLGGPWVAPATGELNTAGSQGVYGQISGMSAAAKWMWFESGKCPGQYSPFSPGCNHKEYLIFRLPAKDLLPPPPCMTFKGNPYVCCLGKNAQGQQIYAFSVVVNNQAGFAGNLTITSSQGTVNTYSPTVLPIGTSVVTGTFTSTASAGSQVCLIFQIQKGHKICKREVCFKLPKCPSKNMDDPVEIDDQIESQ